MSPPASFHKAALAYLSPATHGPKKVNQPFASLAVAPAAQTERDYCTRKTAKSYVPSHQHEPGRAGKIRGWDPTVLVHRTSTVRVPNQFRTSSEPVPNTVPNQYRTGSPP